MRQTTPTTIIRLRRLYFIASFYAAAALLDNSAEGAPANDSAGNDSPAIA